METTTHTIGVEENQRSLIIAALRVYAACLDARPPMGGTERYETLTGQTRGLMHRPLSAADALTLADTLEADHA